MGDEFCDVDVHVCGLVFTQKNWLILFVNYWRKSDGVKEAFHACSLLCKHVK